MDVKIEPSWKTALADEFEKDYFAELTTKVKNAYLAETVFPAPQNIFKAFELCPLDEVRVVILGQDPYHGPGQAQGLSFSVPDDFKIPPSLQNIYKEIKADIGVDIPESGNLERWATQGVLLLNATLTVQKSSPGSHQGIGWELFTDEVIKTISDKRKHVVFLLWGRYAQNKETLIDTNKHLVLRAAHPSPFSAHNGFFGCKHFSQTNEYLQSNNLPEIHW